MSHADALRCVSVAIGSVAGRDLFSSRSVGSDVLFRRPGSSLAPLGAAREDVVAAASSPWSVTRCFTLAFVSTGPVRCDHRARL